SPPPPPRTRPPPPPPPSPLILPYPTLFRSSAVSGNGSLLPNSAIVVTPISSTAHTRTFRATMSPAAGGYGAAIVSFTANDFGPRSEEHTSELQSRENLVCRLLREKKKHNTR